MLISLGTMTIILLCVHMCVCVLTIGAKIKLPAKIKVIQYNVECTGLMLPLSISQKDFFVYLDNIILKLIQES